MKTVNLKNFAKVLRGLLDGSLELHAVPTGRRPARATAKTPASRKKAGRKPLPPSVKKKLQERTKAAKVRAERKALPTPREIFFFLDGKIDGEKLTSLSKNFGVKRSLLKSLMQKLVKSEDVVESHGVYYLQRRLRNRHGKPEPKPEPIAPSTVLSHLAKNPGIAMSELANHLGESSYHRLIKVMSQLKKQDKIRVEGKNYFLAD
ncbi:MAG TPA: hypothetical protein VIV61_01270 [Candidatus Ozemobacteraceae bacterium]